MSEVYGDSFSNPDGFNYLIACNYYYFMEKVDGKNS